MDLRSQTLALLKNHDIRPRNFLGQNFLINRSVIERQVQYADVGKEDTILEVGPGTGVLTEALAQQGARVIAVETDPRMVKVLEERFGEIDSIEIIQGDILKVDIPPFNKCVSNIPYMISSPLTFRLAKTDMELAVILYQKEFASRMGALAGEKNYSRLSVACYYSFEVELMEKVLPSSFHPQPKVSSTVVRLKPKSPPFKVDKEAYFKLVKGLFIHRGKTLKNALFHSHDMVFGQGRTKIEKREALGQLNSRLWGQRVFKTTPEEIAVLLDDIEKAGI